ICLCGFFLAHQYKGKIDYDLAKNYFRDVELKTVFRIIKRRWKKLKDALSIYRMTPVETIKHRSKLNSVKNKLISEWEEKTSQKWP
ncbi:hypothetical protein V7150_22695, partial [Neobacillus drentensis]